MKESDHKNLFHFTKSIEVLKNILVNKEFWVCYSMESANFLKNIFDDTLEISFAYPMVCFCDIPLERHSNHTRKYGSYGIGLKKSWAIEKGVSPVQYVPLNTDVAACWSNTISILNRKFEDPNLDMEVRDCFEQIILISSFLKSYGKGNEVFYNEREWRYFPGRELQNHNQLFWKKEKYEIKVNEKNNGRVDALKSDYKLCFEISDISYLVVPTLEEKRLIKILLLENNLGKIKIKVLR